MQVQQAQFKIYENQDTKVEISKCSICGCEAPKVRIPRLDPNKWGYASKKRAADFYSLMLERPNYFGLILGMYGMGKTVLLFTLILWFFSNMINHGFHRIMDQGTGRQKVTYTGEVCPSQYGKGWLVLYRSKRDSFEYLGLCDVAPVRLFIPKGAKFLYRDPRFPDGNHPNLEIIEHELSDFYGICKQLTRDKINIIAINHFLSGDMSYEWWHLFLKTLLAWKNETVHNMKIPVLFAFDEVRDFIPNRGETSTKAHHFYGNLIRELWDSFRKTGIKVIGTTQSITDLKKVVRSQFGYWLIKKTMAEAVPERFEKRFGRSVIEKLPSTAFFVRDYIGKYNVLPSIWVFLTEGTFAVKTEVPEDVELGLSQQAKEYIWICRVLATALLQTGVASYKTLAILMHRAGSSSIQSFFERTPLDKCPYPIPFTVLPTQTGRPRSCKICIRKEKCEYQITKKLTQPLRWLHEEPQAYGDQKEEEESEEDSESPPESDIDRIIQLEEEESGTHG